MSEYKKQIGIALSIALVAGLAVTAFAFNYLPSGQTTTVVSSTVITQASTTLPMPTFPGEIRTVPLDPSLQVTPTNQVLFDSNATKIVQWVASLLGEAPVTLESEIQPGGPNNTILAYQATYDFRTTAGSEVVVTYLYGQFYELDYRIAGTAANPPVVANATQFAEKLLNGSSASGESLAFQSQVSSAGPGFTDTRLVESFRGLPITGSLARNFDGSHFIEEITVDLLIGPTDNHLNRLFLFSPDWYAIPQDFPLEVQPSQAASAALAVVNSLNSGGNYVTNVSFAFVSGHLYYLVTASNYQVSYYVFVNPRTGEAGFPVL